MSGPLAALERYRDATAIASSPHLAERIGARLLLEPPSTAPRRFLGALRARDVRGVARCLRQNAATAFRPGTRSMLLRAQAMAIVLVTLATVGFGSVAGLAATQQVAQHVVEELADRSSEESTRPAAPGALVAPSVGQPAIRQAGDGPGGLLHDDLPGSVQASGQACGLPAHAEADHLQGSDGERCPAAADDAAVGQGKAEPPAAKGSAKAKAEPPAGKASDKGKADPPAAKGSDQGAKTPSTDSKARAPHEGTAPAPKAKERRRGDRGRD